MNRIANKLRAVVLGFALVTGVVTIPVFTSSSASAVLPAGPTNVQAVAFSTEKLDVTWDAVAGATDYRVQYSTNFDRSDSVYAHAVGPAARLNNLKAQTTYYIWVRAIATNGDNTSEWSTTPTVINTDTAIEDGRLTPKAFDVTASTPTSISYAWEESPGATNYVIELSTTPTMTSPVQYRFTDSPGDITGLVSSKTYYATLRTITAEGDSLSPPTSVVTFATDAAGANGTGAPQRFQASQVGSSTIDFTWAAVAGAVNYKIYWATNDTVTGAASVTTTSTGVRITGLNSNTKYWLRMRTITAGGVALGAWTEILATQTMMPSSGALAPTGLKITKTTSNGFTFVWNKADDVPQYRLWVSSSPDMSLGKVFTYSSTNSKTMVGLSPSTQYYAKVQSVQAGASPASISAYSPGTILGKTKPGTEDGRADVANFAITAFTANSLFFDWDPVPGASNYRISIGKLANQTDAEAHRFSATSGEVLDLDANTLYYAKIQSIDSDGVALSNYTPLITGSTSTTVANGRAVPNGFTAVSSTRYVIKTIWMAVPGAPRYRIQVSKNSSMSNSTYQRFYGTAADVDGLTKNTLYYMRIRTISKDGKTNLSGYSPAISFRTAP